MKPKRFNGVGPRGMSCYIPVHVGADCGQPMQLVGRPKLAKTLPKALQAGSVAALLAKLNTDPQPRRRSDWVDRDRALILTALPAGLRADELLRAAQNKLYGLLANDRQSNRRQVSSREALPYV